MSNKPYDPSNPTDPANSNDPNFGFIQSQDAPVQQLPTDLNQGVGEPGLPRTGPILDVERFRNEYLFGIPLKAPLTGQEVSEATLKQFIRKGISEVETSVRIAVSPVRITEKIDYERAEGVQFNARRLQRWPILKIEALTALWPGRNEGQETPYPTNWVECNADTGLTRVIPKANTEGVPDSVTFIMSTAYQGFTGIMGLKSWPNMWRVTYQSGFDNDRVPDVVNHAIGVCSTIALLSMLGPVLFPYPSQSIGIDGMSQGLSLPGPQWLAERIQELTGERDRILAQLKSHFGTDVQLVAF